MPMCNMLMEMCVGKNNARVCTLPEEQEELCPCNRGKRRVKIECFNGRSYKQREKRKGLKTPGEATFNPGEPTAVKP